MRFIIHLLEMGAHYIGYVLLAVIGGAAHYLGKIRTGEEKGFRWVNLMIDVLGSGFAGLMVALLATKMDFSTEIIYFLTGMAGHMGVRMLFLLRGKAVSLLNLKEPKDK